MSVDNHDPHCPYRSLYEGSQLSLAEMTAHQAAAFNRINDLRHALVLALKRTFPRLFAEAEAQGHQRLSTTTDAVLIAYLNAFLGTIQVRAPRPEGVEDLRVALAKRGLVIPAHLDLSQWAALINATPLTPVPTTPVAVASDDLADLFTSTPPSAPTSRPAPTPPPEPSFVDDWDEDVPVDDSLAELFTSDTPAQVTSDVTGRTLRPEMPVPTTAPAPRGGRKPAAAPPKRESRAKAQPPDPLMFDVPAETPVLDAHGELSDRLRQALVAATCIPRPVFLADLEPIAGSRDVLEAWERESWANPRSAVGFVAAKPRHRARGSLVVPKQYAEHAAPEFNRSLWAACLQNHLTGARLYETAVLLHRVGEEITNWQFSAQNRTLVLTLSQRRGLVALVVVLEQKKDLIHEALREEVPKLFDQRLVLASVLVTHDPNYSVVRSALLDEAERAHWRPPFPVTMSRSWEFGLSNATSDLVLGT